MRKTNYVGVAILIAVIVLAGSLIGFRRYLPYTGAPLLPKKPPAVVLSMTGARFVGLSGRTKAWSLSAKRVEMQRDRVSTVLTGITDGKIFLQGKVAAEVTAGKASYNTWSRDLDLSDGVTVTGTAGQQVRSAGATWNSGSAILRSKGKVSYTGGQSTILADELMVEMQKKEMTLRNVRMSVPMEELQTRAETEAPR